MSAELWTDVDNYFTRLFIGDDAVLGAALADSEAGGLPPIQVSANQGKLLMLMARMLGARSILEVGTLGGYSAIWLARGLAEEGRLVTLELDPGYAEVARGNLERAGLADRVDIRVGDAKESLATLTGPFDLIFIDADKEGYPEYFVRALELSRVGTVIVGDNVVRDGAVIDPATDDPRVLGIRRFNELVAAEPRVQATAIQMVGTKGYDGFAVALVTAGR